MEKGGDKKGERANEGDEAVMGMPILEEGKEPQGFDEKMK